jgi:hypothetical protein
MFPFIQLLGWTSLCGAGTLPWYRLLSPQDKDRADRIAEDLASDWCGRAKNRFEHTDFTRVRNRADFDFN